MIEKVFAFSLCSNEKASFLPANGSPIHQDCEKGVGDESPPTKGVLKTRFNLLIGSFQDRNLVHIRVMATEKMFRPMAVCRETRRTVHTLSSVVCSRRGAGFLVFLCFSTTQSPLISVSRRDLAGGKQKEWNPGAAAVGRHHTSGSSVFE